MSSLTKANAGSPMNLDGMRVLIVEDEFLAADEMTRDFESYGIRVVGPVASLAAAQTVVASEAHLDGAVLDINLRGQITFELIDALRARDVPCVLYTGYDHAMVPAAYHDVPFCPKPNETADIVKALFA